MNLFENYKPIKENEKKKKELLVKILDDSKRQLKTKSSRLRIQLGIGAAAILLFIVSLGLFGERTKSPQSTADSGVAEENLGSPNLIVEHLTFSGESEHWEAVSKVYSRRIWLKDDNGALTTESFKDGAFQLVYQGEPPEDIKDFVLEIKGDLSTTRQTGNFREDGVYRSHEVFSSDKDIPLKVTVEWNGKKETFQMTSQPEAYSKWTAADRPDLSTVKPYGDYPFIGISGSGDFQIASTGSDWGKFSRMYAASFGDMNENSKIPALLSADGNQLSQSMFFLLSGVSPSDDIQVIGTHNGKKKILLSDPGDARILRKRFGGDIAIPAVVQFEDEGVWTLSAYANDNEIGSATIGVYQEPLIEKATSSVIEGDTLRTLAATITADWSRNDRLTSLGRNPTMKIETRDNLFKDKPIHNPFPIVVTGTPISKGEPFVQIFSEDDVSKKSGKYVFETTLPIEKQGKWNLTIFVGEYPMGNVMFFVR